MLLHKSGLRKTLVHTKNVVKTNTCASKVFDSKNNIHEYHKIVHFNLLLLDEELPLEESDPMVLSEPLFPHFFLLP